MEISKPLKTRTRIVARLKSLLKAECSCCSDRRRAILRSASLTLEGAKLALLHGFLLDRSNDPCFFNLSYQSMLNRGRSLWQPSTPGHMRDFAF